MLGPRNLTPSTSSWFKFKDHLGQGRRIISVWKLGIQKENKFTFLLSRVFLGFSVSVTSLLAFCLLGRVSGAEYSHSAVWNSWSFNSFLTVGPGLSDLLLADIAGCLFAFDFGIHSGEIRMQESGSSVLNCVLQNTPGCCTRKSERWEQCRTPQSHWGKPPQTLEDAEILKSGSVEVALPSWSHHYYPGFKQFPGCSRRSFGNGL